jgi:hypothetical protein
LNDFQHDLATAILDTQAAITDVFPLLELTYANGVAQNSGAGDLLTIIPQYSQQLLGIIGIPLPSGISGSFLSSLPSIYAYPINALDPLDALSLHAVETAGSSMPWQWPEWLKGTALAEWEVGKIVCQADPWQFGSWDGSFSDHDDTSDDHWGWDDSYYAGHPGFLTWIAGTAQQGDLAGIGQIRWLAGGSPPADVQYTFLKQSNLQMYEGSAFIDQQSSAGYGTPGAPLMLPAFIAVASSQVEGGVVIDHGNSSWAVQTLIPVYFAKGGDATNPEPGTDDDIYH